MKKTDFYRKNVIACILAVALIFGGCSYQEPTAYDNAGPSQSMTGTQVVTPDSTGTAAPTDTGTPTGTGTATPTDTAAPTHTATPTMNAGIYENTGENGVSLSDIPAYSGNAYVSVNDNQPFFNASELTATAYESYSNLDSLGRCGVAVACCGKEIMPTGERGNISSVKPSGWVQAQYSFVSGGYLYNRCHLIGWQLSAENANEKNLITGTRYFNTEAMLPFENMVADYIKETGNHVMYRVTPMYDGNNLVASGVLLEGYSVEDNGEGICFNVYCYNVQPGVEINYATGGSSLKESAATNTTTPTKAPTKVPTKEPTKAPTPTPVVTEKPVEDSDNEAVAATFILNISTKKIHHPGCRSIDLMAEKNKKEYTGDMEDLLEDGYTTCGNCF